MKNRGRNKKDRPAEKREKGSVKILKIIQRKLSSVSRKIRKLSEAQFFFLEPNKNYFRAIKLIDQKIVFVESKADLSGLFTKT